MPMKAIVAASLLALASAALAEDRKLGAPPAPGPQRLQLPSQAPAKRKPANDRYTPEVLSLFVDGIMFDKAGDHDKALRSYKDANEKSEQANTYFNLADLQRRHERYKDAIASYKKYLDLAPDAADRKDVERAIADLERTPFLAVIDGDAPDAVILVDGVLIGPSPQVLQLATGYHHIDRISPAGFDGENYEAKPSVIAHLEMNPHGDKPETGNVVLSGSAAINSSGAWDDPVTKLRYRFPGRMQLAPGRYETDLWEPGRLCGKLVFDVPKSRDLTYVYVDAKLPAERGGCMPFKVRTQQLKVGAP